MARDNDNNNTRGPRKPPSRSGGRPGGGGVRFRDDKGGGGKRFGEKRAFGEKRPFAGKRSFGDRPATGRAEAGPPSAARPFRGKPFAEKAGGFRKDRDDAPRGERHEGGFRKEGGFKKDFKPRDRDAAEARPRRPWSKDRPPGERTFAKREDRAPREFNRDDRPPRGDRPERSASDKRSGPDKRSSSDKRSGSDKPWRARSDAPRGERRDGKPGFSRDRGGKPPFKRDDGKPPFRRDRDERPAREPREGRAERPRFDRPREDRPRGNWGDHPRSERGAERPRDDRAPGRDVRSDKPRGEGGRFERPRDGRRSEHSFRERPSGERTVERKPPRARGDFARPRGEAPEAAAEAPKVAASAKAKAKAKAGERIAKVVARAGLCSRREAEAWITDGRVAVNGRVITSPALDIVEGDAITIDGKPLPPREPTRLFLYHKPRGLVTTHADPEGRATVFEALPDDLPRVISVGRLDYNTEGLLLLTNDGGLARALELPANGSVRRYRVRAHGSVTQPQLDALKDGIEIDGVRYGPIAATLDRDQGANVWISFEISEGKNREVRNVLAHLGLDVNRLIRVGYGPFQLGDLAEGAIEEVPRETLRDQLGEKIAMVARIPKAGVKAAVAQAAPRKPRRAGLIADRKGRRVLVERGDDGPRGGDDGPGRPPKRRYHGKRA